MHIYGGSEQHVHKTLRQMFYEAVNDENDEKDYPR